MRQRWLWLTFVWLMISGSHAFGADEDAASYLRAFPDPIPADIAFDTVVNSQPFPPLKYPVPIIGWKAHPEEVHVTPTGALVFPPPRDITSPGLYLAPLVGARSAAPDTQPASTLAILDPDHVSRRLVDGYLPGVDSAWIVDGIQVRQLAFCTLLAGTEVPTGTEPLIALTRHQLTNKSDAARRITFALNFGRELRRHSMLQIPPAYEGNLDLDGSLVIDGVNRKVVAALLGGRRPDVNVSFRRSDIQRPVGRKQYTVLNWDEVPITGPEYSIELTRTGQIVRVGHWHSDRGFDLYYQASPMHGVNVGIELEVVTPDGLVRKAGALFRNGFSPSTTPAGEYIPPGDLSKSIPWSVLSRFIPQGACTLRLRCFYPSGETTQYAGSWEPIVYLTEPGTTPAFKKHESGNPAKSSLWLELTLAPGESKALDLAVPYFPLDREQASALDRLNLDDQLAVFSRFWTDELNHHAEFIVPEERVRNAYRACLAYNLILCDRDPVTGFLMPHPDATDYEWVWGGDSGVTIPAMDRMGLHDLTGECLDWFLAKQGHRKPEGEVETQQGFFSGDTPPRWMNENGFILHALAQHYRLSRDAHWLRRVAPQLIQAGDWIARERARTKKLENGTRPRHFGLLPKGRTSDLDTWDYWYWTDTYNYMGLRATAEALADVGMAEQASRLTAEADDYKACILDSLDRSINRQAQPPFVPLSPYRNDTPTFEILDRDWYSICSPIYMVEAGLFDAKDDRAAWTHAWLEKLVTITGLPALGKGQIDPHYVYNTALSHLLRGETDKFVWTFYSLLAYGQSRDTYATIEGMNILTGSNGPAWDANRQPHMHSNGRVLDMLRIAMVLEDGPTLHLLAGTPPGWLADGRTIEIKRAPTLFGPLNLKAASHLAAGTIHVLIDPPQPKTASVVLHIHSPANVGPIRSVTVNNQPWTDFTAETIRLGPLKTRTDIRCRY
jgi:hypothetical protein